MNKKFFQVAKLLGFKLKSSPSIKSGNATYGIVFGTHASTLTAGEIGRLLEDFQNGRQKY